MKIAKIKLHYFAKELSRAKLERNSKEFKLYHIRRALYFIGVFR